MKPWIQLMRPKHWIKNVLVALPLVFSGNLIDGSSLRSLLMGIAAFSLAASSVYVINDLMDAEKDRLHPTKRNRPIASGAVSVPTARALIIVLCGGAIALSCVAGGGWTSVVVLCAYVAMNLCYSMGLKSVPIVDVTILAAGYLARIWYGAMVCGIEVSGWLYLTVLAGSFFLGMGKRRGEIDEIGTETREVLKGYTRDFLDKNMYVCLGLTISFYALWARELGARLWTVPLILLIFMRYSYDIERGGDGDPMEVVLADKMLMGLAVAYAISVLIIIYL